MFMKRTFWSAIFHENTGSGMKKLQEKMKPGLSCELRVGAIARRADVVALFGAMKPNVRSGPIDG
jgi:hypothetical protein